MSNDEFLDKHIHRLNGVWPDSETAVSEPDIWFYLAYDYLKDEFQQRARELGYGVEAAKPEGWYDYTNQKALRLPPVGVECEMLTCNKWELIKMVGFDDGFAVVKYLDDKSYHSQSGLPKFYRPLDHATRKAEAERKRVVDAVMKFWMSVDTGTTATFEKLYDAGFLRMPEDT